MSRGTQPTQFFLLLTSVLLQVPGVPKYAAEDTTFTTTNFAGETVVVPVPKDTSITLHVAGLHYNRTSNVRLD